MCHFKNATPAHLLKIVPAYAHFLDAAEINQAVVQIVLVRARVKSIILYNLP